MKMPELQEVVGYYCNKCGKFPESSEHEGCSYLAVGVPRGYTKAEVQAYTKQALIDLLDSVADEIKVESDYSGSNRRMHLQSILPKIQKLKETL